MTGYALGCVEYVAGMIVLLALLAWAWGRLDRRFEQHLDRALTDEYQDDPESLVIREVPAPTHSVGGWR